MIEHNFAKLYTASLDPGMRERLTQVVEALRGEMYLAGVSFSSFQPLWTVPEMRGNLTPLSSRDTIAILFRDLVPVGVVCGAIHPYVDLYVSEKQNLSSDERFTVFERLQELFALREISHEGLPAGHSLYEVRSLPRLGGAPGLDDISLPTASEAEAPISISERAEQAEHLLNRMVARYRLSASDPGRLLEPNFISDSMLLLTDTLQAFNAFVIHDCRHGEFKHLLDSALLTRRCLDAVRNEFSLLINVIRGPDEDVTPIIANNLKIRVSVLQEVMDRLFRGELC